MVGSSATPPSLRSPRQHETSTLDDQGSTASRSNPHRSRREPFRRAAHRWRVQHRDVPARPGKVVGFLPTSQNGALFSPRGQQRPRRNRAPECAKVERNHLPKLRTVARAGMDGSRVHAPPRRVLATLCAHAHGGSPALGWFPSYLQLRGGRARSVRARPKCNSKTVQQDLRPHTPAALRDGLMMRKQQGQCG